MTDYKGQGQEKTETGETANLLCDHLRAHLSGLISQYQEDWQREHAVFSLLETRGFL